MNSKPRRFSKLSLLMAAYNEEATLRRCAERVLAVPLPEGLVREIVLVDDGSTDATWEIAQRLAARHPEIRIFNQPRNMGKGAAVRRAIKEMTGDIALAASQARQTKQQTNHRDVILEPIRDWSRSHCLIIGTEGWR